MEIVAVQKYIIGSPKKLRPVADMVKKLKPIEAVDVLPHLGKKGAQPLTKVIKTAIANAKNSGVSDTDLIFKEIQINEGPRLKRGRPVSRGRWHPYKRRMSHIRVVLTTKEAKVAKTSKPETKKAVTPKSKVENKKPTTKNKRKKGTKRS